MYEIDPEAPEWGVVTLLIAVLDGRAMLESTRSTRHFSRDSVLAATTTFTVRSVGRLEAVGTPLTVAERILLAVFERLPESVKLETAERLMVTWGEIAQSRQAVERLLTSRTDEKEKRDGS